MTKLRPDHPESASRLKFGTVFRVWLNDAVWRFRAILKNWLAPRIFPVIFEVDRLVIWLARGSQRIADTRDVVFIRVDNLGDFIVWLPVARALREQWPWPGRRFVLIANPAWTGFAQSLGLFDEIIPVDRFRFRRNPFYRVSTLFFVGRKFGADLLVNPMLRRDPITVDTIARAVDSKRKVAALSDWNDAAVDVSLSNHWYDQLIAPQCASIHEAARNRSFIELATGIRVPDARPALITVNGPVPRALSGSDYVVMAPGASSPLRAWPAAEFARLANQFAAETQLRVVLVGTASERRQAAAVRTNCAFEPIDLVGQLDMDGLLAVLSNAKIIITNETGTAHIGAALGVPTVCITGGGHFGRFVPYPADSEDAKPSLTAVSHPMECYQCNWWCIYRLEYGSTAPCVSLITVEAVWQTARALLRPV